MGDQPISVLLIDDDEESYLLTRLLFTRMGGRFTLEWVDTAEKAQVAIDADSHDLYLVDYMLGAVTGLELLRYARKRGCKAPMIMLTVVEDREMDLEAIDAGASDYLVKGQIDARLLERSMRYAIERNRMTEALLESRERLSTVIAHAPIVLFALDAEGILTLAEGAALSSMGVTAKDVVGKPLRNFYTDHPTVLTAIDRALAGEEFATTLEFNGFVFEVRMRPSFDREGNLQASFGLAIDITSWKKAEESLRKSEERYELASRATNDAIWDWDIPAGILSWNPNVYMLFRYVPDDIGLAVGWWSESLHPDDKERVVAGVKRVLEEKRQFWRDEYRFRCGDGTYAYVLDRGYLVLDQDGEPVRMIGAMTDLTRRKEVEDALRRSEEQYRRIVETAHEGIWMVDSQGRTTFANARMTEILGYTLAEMMERRVFDFMDEEWQRIAILYLDRRRGKEVAEQHDFKFIRKDGSPVWAILSTSPVFASDGSEAGTLAMVTDITARKLAEDALQEAHDQLEMRVTERTAEIVDMMARLEGAHQMQQRFVADASHDLRTPLTVMRAEIDLLLHRSELDERTRGSLIRINAQSKRLEDLASDLLLLATIDSNQAAVLADHVHLDGLLFDCVAQLTTLAREKNIAWNISVDEPVELKCNASMLSRALMNVLENSIKYSSEGSSVEVILQVKDGAAVVAVSDNGIGIPKNDLPRIFDRFYRGDLTRNTAGTGLGLAIVKAVVDAHRGSVVIRSQPGSGTRIQLSFPLS